MADVIRDIPNTQYIMIDNFLIDVAIREEYEFDAEVTDFPTESGKSFADNIRKRPTRITIEGVVSNSPIGPIALYRRPEQGALSRTGTPSDLGAHSVGEAFVALNAVWNRSEPVTIRTSLTTYNNMAMTSLVVPRDAQTGAVFHFTATFQQIEISTNQRLVRKRTATRGSGGKNRRGSQAVGTIVTPGIIWRKGRDATNTYYVGGGNYFGDHEKIVEIRFPDGISQAHDNSLLAGFNAALGVTNFEFVTDADNNELDAAETAQKRYVRLTPEEKARYVSDRKRDLRRQARGEDLEDSIIGALADRRNLENNIRKIAHHGVDMSKVNRYVVEDSGDMRSGVARFTQTKTTLPTEYNYYPKGANFGRF